MSVLNTKLTLAASRVARANPQLWQDFVAAFAELHTTTSSEMISSSLPTLPLAQGRAQITRDLLRDLGNCMADADQIEQRKKTR